MSKELVRLIAGLCSVAPERVEHLLQHDESFREMCDEFQRCQETVQRWRATLPKHLSRIDEYDSLSRELESEIALYLQQRRGNGGHA